MTKGGGVIKFGTVSEALDRLSEVLDVPPSKYREAQDHYDAVGNWLDADDSPLRDFRPRIYPQGSFLLGTAIHPRAEGEYDVDAVCLLQEPPPGLTQQRLKRMVGDRLRQHNTYAQMLDPKEGGRRCWTLHYSDESRFHLDVLPAVPDDPAFFVSQGVKREWAATAIKITDSQTWKNPLATWPRSNPLGYAAWFKNQMRIRLEEGRKIVAMEKRADVQAVPDYEVRTPLQRLVQLLKRHRDEHYEGDDDAPISIIITTLAAKSYDDEADLEQAMTNVVPRMRDHIECRQDGRWVENPVHRDENFADKWKEVPRKEKVFHEWLDQVEADHEDLIQSVQQQRGELIVESLTKAFGSKEPRAAAADANQIAAAGGPIKVSANQALDAPHRQKPSWPMAVHHRVSVSCSASRNGFRDRPLRPGDQVASGWTLRFEATTEAPPPHEVYWQVVNTGPEARRAGDLRGGFTRASRVHTETTRYRGIHWIQCFLVKDGRCIAKSSEFIVDIS